MLRLMLGLVTIINLSGCITTSVVTPADAATAGDNGTGGATGGTMSAGSGGQMSSSGGDSTHIQTGGSHTAGDAAIASDASDAADAAHGDGAVGDGAMSDGSMSDGAMPGTDAGVGNLCGGIAALSCTRDLICIDDPRDACDPAKGGADCIGVCVRDALCGGIAAIACPVDESCVDDPRDSCDPQNGGADCGGLCLPASATSACAASDCGGPTPGAPNKLCSDGVTVAGPACLPNKSGACAWQIVTCP